MGAHDSNNAGEGASAPAELRCQLYLISPLDVSGAFPERLARALAGGLADYVARVAVSTLLETPT